MADRPAARRAGLAASDRPAAAPGVATAQLDGEVVVLDTAGHVHLLNATAGLLWLRFDGHETLDHIAKEIAEHFRLPVEEALADVCTLADQLTRLGLLVAEPDAPTAG